MDGLLSSSPAEAALGGAFGCECACPGRFREPVVRPQLCGLRQGHSFRDNAGLEIHIGNTGDTFHWRPRWVGPWHNDEEWKPSKNSAKSVIWSGKNRGRRIHSHASTLVCGGQCAPFHLHLDGILEFDKRYLAEEPLDPPNVFFCTALTVVMLIGLRRLWRDNRPVAVLFAMVLFFFPAIYYVTHVEVYFRRQIDPLILVLAVYGVLPEERDECSRDGAGVARSLGLISELRFGECIF